MGTASANPEYTLFIILIRPLDKMMEAVSQLCFPYVEKAIPERRQQQSQRREALLTVDNIQKIIALIVTEHYK